MGKALENCNPLETVSDGMRGEQAANSSANDDSVTV
jgi:hypothetical protein